MDAAQVVKDSEAKMATVKSASFTADFGLQVQGDTTKMTDPTAKALLSRASPLHAEGASAKDPTAADMTMSLGIAGQNLDFGMKSPGKKSWLEYQGTWYALDGKNAKALDKQAQNGAAPTQQLKSMGIDPSTWGTTFQMVGTEDLDGVQVYHVKARGRPAEAGRSRSPRRPRARAWAASSAAPAVSSASSARASRRTRRRRNSSPRRSRTPPSSTGSASTTSTCTRRSSAARWTRPGQKDMQGVTGVTMKGTVTMSDFDQPVTVTPPAGAKSFKEFMNQLFGGLLGGSGRAVALS